MKSLQKGLGIPEKLHFQNLLAMPSHVSLQMFRAMLLVNFNTGPGRNLRIAPFDGNVHTLYVLEMIQASMMLLS